MLVTNTCGVEPRPCTEPPLFFDARSGSRRRWISRQDGRIVENDKNAVAENGAQHALGGYRVVPNEGKPFGTQQRSRDIPGGDRDRECASVPGGRLEKSSEGLRQTQRSNLRRAYPFAFPAGISRASDKSGMRKNVCGFPPASRSNLLESITLMILGRSGLKSS
ncbi:hypothetical protein NGR_b02290 (plasmid) [Sinorhizobium fredii NGR234]|uniref:Uncharacterized protein n=1 Tax=Sinorhizobium fredii (strain NBRC 101917 / NGR234) TaxID=394 RepID=C3KNN7_SINFN|nr:hypothetical protein NGR_b02290 [Sinorhizobium fredii NGR234]